MDAKTINSIIEEENQIRHEEMRCKARHYIDEITKQQERIKASNELIAVLREELKKLECEQLNVEAVTGEKIQF